MAAYDIDPFDVESLQGLPTAATPKSTLKLHGGIAIGQDGAREASLAPYLRCEPFQVPDKFVAVRQDDGSLWYGLPMLFATAETYSNATLEFAYIKWLSLPFCGLERDMLPVPSTFACFQWAVVDQMGTDGGSWQPQSFSVVDITRIAHIAPIVQIGELPAAIQPSVMKTAKRVLGVQRKHWPWKQLRPGPLFMLNAHAYL